MAPGPQHLEEKRIKKNSSLLIDFLHPDSALSLKSTFFYQRDQFRVVESSVHFLINFAMPCVYLIEEGFI